MSSKIFIPFNFFIFLNLLEHRAVQTCGILSGGNEDTLKAIHSLVKDGMPVVVLKNSGGLADILTECLEDTEVGQRNLHKRAVTEGSRDSDIFRLSPANIRQAVLTYWERMEKPDIVIFLIQDLLESSKLLCPYDAEEDELDYHVLLLLLGPTEEAATANVETQFAKLEIAIALNRSDVARQKVFLDGLKWDNDKLGSYMMSFLLQENVEFMKLFLEKGFDLKAYVTCETMERLYTYAVRRATQKRALVNVIRHLVKLPERINLLLIGKVLTLLMGNRYFPVYLEPNFAQMVETNKQEKMPNCPATHLFIWALLTEHNDTATFFWTQTQEPLGAALMAACLLRRFARFADSVVNREELIEFSKLSSNLKATLLYVYRCSSYEEKANGLLSECYSQDPENTAEILVRERSLFGQVSCIMLASDGNSMSFISHRCSEQCLERTWCGAIDRHGRRFAENHNFVSFCWYVQFFISLITGVVMPPLVPFTIKFNLEATKQPNGENGKGAPVDRLSRKSKNSKLVIDDDRTTEASFKLLKDQMAHLVFLCFFVYVLLFNTARQTDYDLTASMILLIWVLSFFIENVRQATTVEKDFIQQTYDYTTQKYSRCSVCVLLQHLQGFTSGLSFRAYIKRIWKSLELIAVALYILGTALHLMMVAEAAIHFGEMPIDPVETVQETLLRMADVFYGLSLFLFFFRLLEAFTADITIGPLVVMVKTMVVKDLLPFLALFVVCLFSFAVLQWVIAFKYTASQTHVQNLRTLFDALQMAYFQIFGEYSLEDLTEKKRPECTESNINCHDDLSPWFSPILLGAFVILTQVLLLNLLVAMFASTYVRIEAASTGYWALQRYHLICEFVQRSPLPPPLILIWHFYLLIKYLIRRCRGEQALNYHPFKRSYIYQPSRERQLIHWERLRFWDYQRYVLQGRTRKKKRNQKSINVRTTVLTGQTNNPVTVQLNTAFENFQLIVNQNMREILSQTKRVDELDRKVDQILKILKGMHDEFMMTTSYGRQFKQMVRCCLFSTSQLLRDFQETTGSGTPIEKTEATKLFGIGSTTDRPVRRTSRKPQPPPVQTKHEELQGLPTIPASGTESKQSEVQGLKVYEGNQHTIAMFSPPTADSTPSLYATPLPWDNEKSEGEALGWRPSPFPAHGWTESDDFEEAMRTRLWNPMGTAHQPGRNNPPPDPIRGVPRNPTGRTGVGGKGRLPVWGANPAVIIVLTREQKPEENSAEKTFDGSSDRLRLEYAVIAHRVAFQLPWFLVRHPSTCNGLDCTKSLVDLFVHKRAEEVSQAQPDNRQQYEKTEKAYHEAQFQQVWKGYLNDMINTDNAWIEPIVVNVHFQPGETEQTEILRVRSLSSAEQISSVSV
ncbi:transient receptor potential cation channel subfamily M member 2 [Paragonimus westermani]|uniref:Transient receptor potential cation channel subfamily M member 2 n=1 Tax=Paragonimus westermani TaxID=34504 RepID=A0A5J4NN17_9TREM|nr:transient receptor potential cation channel subfamily M member 2 [Paragonimus westermani]